jgi:hypothetical protein
LNGDLAELEVVDLEDPAAATVIPTSGKSADGFIDIDELSSSPTKDPVFQSRAESVRPVSDKTAARDGAEPLLAPPNEPPTQTTVARSQAQNSNMPNYRGFSTAELAKQIAKFGFKPIKKRETAIELLEECWESQNKRSCPPDSILGRPAAPRDPTAVGFSKKSTGRATKAASAPAKPKAASKTNKATTKATAKTSKAKAPSTKRQATKTVTAKRSQPEHALLFEEIADSTDEDTIPSPPKDISYDMLSSLDELDSTTATTLPLQDLSNGNKGSKTRSAGKKAENLPDISLQITAAITKQPRIRALDGTKRPTWHEKILMYDPIWLDDFTDWLNSEGLQRIGERRSVSRLTVREWCESKGVCCTWRRPGAGK